jgi:hypothetical protein
MNRFHLRMVGIPTIKMVALGWCKWQLYHMNRNAMLKVSHEFSGSFNDQTGSVDLTS